MSTDHRISLADAAKRMGVKYADVFQLVVSYKLDGGKDNFGWWVDDRAVEQWIAKHRKEN